MFIVFVSVFSVMIITMLIMAVGVMFGREPIKGSCGGLGAVGVERACGCVDVCQNELAASEVSADDESMPTSSTDSVKAKVEIYRP